jgi:hypothetical protein
MDRDQAELLRGATSALRKRADRQAQIAKNGTTEGERNSSIRTGEAPKPLPPKHTGGKFKKGVSGNPGGKKKGAFVLPASKPAPKPVKKGTKKATPAPKPTQGGKKTPEPQVIGIQPPAPEVKPAPQPAPQPPQTAPQPSSAPEAEKAEKTAQKQRHSGFQPGQSGNPAGRPKGARNRVTRLVEALLDGQAKELTQRAVEMALAGDASVMRALLDRLISPVRERPVTLEIPKINTAYDLIAAAASLTDPAASGDITPGEAASLSTLVGNVAKVIETAEIVDQLTKLEKQLAAKGGNS